MANFKLAVLVPYKAETPGDAEGMLDDAMSPYEEYGGWGLDYSVPVAEADPSALAEVYSLCASQLGNAEDDIWTDSPTVEQIRESLDKYAGKYPEGTVLYVSARW